MAKPTISPFSHHIPSSRLNSRLLYTTYPSLFFYRYIPAYYLHISMLMTKSLPYDLGRLDWKKRDLQLELLSLRNVDVAMDPRS